MPSNLHGCLDTDAQALLTLNSCPMFALVERELPKMPMPARAHFPPRPDAILAYGLSEDADRQEDVGLP